MQFDVVVIGAGPAGTVAAALLEAKGYRVQIIEKQHFPRFSIGESLLPYCMEFLEEAGLLEAVKAAASEHHFQFKNGAAFVRGEKYSDFNFQRKFSEGPGTTYQVQRDASGFGRVLPRLLELDRPSNFPSRTSLFTHIEDNIPSNEFDREKIRVTVHHQHQDVWFWLIPFSNGRCSLGVVAKSEFFEQFDSSDPQACLRQIIDDEPSLKELLRHANFDTPARMITGYSSDVSRLWGDGFALLGNAGEFLDPVFSSGVTIAMKSAKLAVETLDKQLKGQQVDWQAEYAEPLSAGVNTFRVFVEAWYDGRFQDIIFAENRSTKIEEMISSILAGYAWDEANPYVKESERRMNTLAELCRLS